MSQLTAELRVSLANRFSPVLVLYPEFGKKGGCDYHPRDIRLVLSLASGQPELQAEGLLGFIPRLARQWPEPILGVAGFFSFCSAILLSLGLLSSRGVLPVGIIVTPGFIVPAVALALLTPPALVASGFAAVLVPWLKWIGTFVWTAVALVLLGALLIDLLTDVMGSQEAAALVVVQGAFVLLQILFGIRFARSQDRNRRPNPSLLLLYLTGLLNRDAYKEWVEQELELARGGFLRKLQLAFSWAFVSLRRPGFNESRMKSLSERVSLRYFDTGSARDVKRHEMAYERAVAKAISDSNGRKDLYPPTAYANVTFGVDDYGDFVAIQYWMAYFYNDWANLHQMDWEQVTVFARRKEGDKSWDRAEPAACAFSAHQGGIVAKWPDLWWSDGSQNHPNIFVAKGSHANYPRAGRRRPEMPFAGLKFTGKDLGILGRDPEKYVDETSPWFSETEVKPTIVTIPEVSDNIWKGCPDENCASRDQHGICVHDFRWLNLRGLWGSPGGLFGDSAPKSPPAQIAWRPFDWLEDCNGFTEAVGERFLLDGS